MRKVYSKYFKWLLVLTFLPASLSVVARQYDCTHGSPNAEKCIALLRKAEAKLETALAQKEQALRAAYAEKDYGGRENGAYLQEALEYVRTSNQAFLKFRDAECLAQIFAAGFTPRYAYALAESCKLDMTLKRIKTLNQGY